MNKLYNNHTKKGARVRVLGTNEVGTVAEKHLIRKDGQTKVYCKVVLDKDPGRIPGTSPTSLAIRKKVLSSLSVIIRTKKSL